MNKQQSAVYYSYPRLFILSFIILLAVSFSINWLRDAPVKAHTENEFPEIVIFNENFDGVTAPALPAGWTTSASGQLTPFLTITTLPDSAPNSIFVDDPNVQGTSELVSPSIALGNGIPHKLIFRHFYQTDFEFDGCVLELSINGGAFQDIISAGGTFVTGGYNTALVSGTLSGRQSWTGQQAGYITTEVNLPASTINQSVRFRWRIGTDDMEAGTGWRIDNVQVVNAISAINSNAISIPGDGTASPYPSEVTLTNHDGLITGVQVTLTNFSHNSPDDVDLLLVAPNGNKVVLMSDVGGSNPVTNLNLTFSDAATASLPDNSLITGGNYKPTNFEPGDNFPAPAPIGAPTGGRLSALNGLAPNGTWKLFLIDDSGNNAGNISGGWTLFVQSSPNAIAIPEVGTAQPYASEKTINGVQGTITKATVTLSNFSHTSPDDVDLMLVAPNGRRIVLMSDVGGNTEIGGLNLTFDDAAATNLPDNAPLTTGTYKPTDFEPGDTFPAPAPQGATTGTTLDAFYGSAPTGVWKLFAVDDNGANAGSIAGSWNINLQTSVTACAFTLSPLVQAFPITGGSGNFSITMPGNCSWTASTNSGFITINSNISGNGNGTVGFSVAPNMTGGRAGTIDISNGVVTRTFQVQQPSGCPFSLNQTAVNIGAAGGNGNVGVTAGSICSWQATSSASWVQITSALQTGDGTATFSVQQNTSSNSRSATITVGARTFTVNQAGAIGRRYDFDGDSKSDLSVFRPSSSVWYILNSGQAGAFSAAQFGISTDKITPADFDGDRRADIAVYRNGVWYLLLSQSNSVRIQNWGLSDDAPVPADYDGDGTADIAVYRPSTGIWYVLRSLDGGLQTAAFGSGNDKPVPADYDGDGRTDIAVYRSGAIGTQSSWWVLQSSTSSTASYEFGLSGDITVPADYDGDGRDNIAVFRPSNGTWYTSLNAATNYDSVQWGASGDVPAAADYNGDGRADHTVFRQGVWYIFLSGTGNVRIDSWGLSGDMVVPAAYASQ